MVESLCVIPQTETVIRFIRARRKDTHKYMSSKAQEEKEESSTTVKFNVGGKLYEVSKSLLNGFPDTVLAEKASSSSSSSPVFIDRDPDRFAFCLDYMRDNGKVHLPENVPKLAFLEELDFFGFADVDETKINDEKSKQNSMVRFHQITEATKQRIIRLEKELAMEKVALKCLQAGLQTKGTFTTACFVVNYSDVPGTSNVHIQLYFKECCDKLGLRVEGHGGSKTSVKISRKTMISGK